MDKEAGQAHLMEHDDCVPGCLVSPIKGFTELIDDMYLHQSPFLTDVTFRLKNGETRTAHRLLLALASPFFKAKFCGYWTDKLDQVVEMTDIDVSTFSIVLRHIYSPTTVSLDHLQDLTLWDLYNVAEMFLLPSLCRTVERKLERVMLSLGEKKTLFLHFEKAKMFNILLDTIKQELLKYAGTNFDNNEFFSLPADIATEILGWTELLATEGQIFYAASMWCQRNAISNLIAIETFEILFKNLIKVEYLSEDELVSVIIPESNILGRETLADWTRKVISNKPKKLFRFVNLKQKSFSVRLNWISLALLQIDGMKTYTFDSEIEFESNLVYGVAIIFSNEKPEEIAVKCWFVGEDARFYVKYKTEGSAWIIRDQYKYLTDVMMIPIGKTDLEMGTVELSITVDTRKSVPLRIVKLEEYILDIDNVSNLGEIKQYHVDKTLKEVAKDESREGYGRLWFVRSDGFPPVPITEQITIVGTTFKSYLVADMALYDANTQSFFILEESSEKILPILGNRRILAVSLIENDIAKFLGSISVKTSGSFLKIDENFVKLAESKCRSNNCEEGVDLSIQSPGKMKWSIHEGHGLNVDHLDSVVVRKFKLLRWGKNPFYSSFDQTDPTWSHR